MEESKNLKEFKLFGTIPSANRRYNRDVAIDAILDWPLQPFESVGLDDCSEDDIDLWKIYIHPEGQPYFCREETLNINVEKTITSTLTFELRFITELYLRQEETRRDAENAVQQLLRTLHLSLLELGNNHPEKALSFRSMDVFFDFYEEYLEYYVVEPDRKRVFWLQEYNAKSIARPIRGVASKTQLRYAFNKEYWSHVEFFPHLYDVSDVDRQRLLLDLQYGFFDDLTSITSAFQFNSEEAKDMRAILQDFSTSQHEELARPYLTVCIARLHSIFANEKFFNFYGENGVRLRRVQSVRGRKDETLWLIGLLSPLLFFAPNTHFRGLRQVWVDHIVQKRSWKDFLEKLVSEWEMFVLFSTVLLNANVAFLAVPNVINSDPGTTSSQVLKASGAQIASQVSTIMSIGCIVIGLILSRLHRVKADAIDEAAEFLSRRGDYLLGLQRLAIVYSLPYALLLWGMISFLIAVAFTCFDKSDTVQRVINACVWASIVFLTFWTIVTAWETRKRMNWRDLTGIGLLFRIFTYT